MEIRKQQTADRIEFSKNEVLSGNGSLQTE